MTQQDWSLSGAFSRAGRDLRDALEGFVPSAGKAGSGSSSGEPFADAQQIFRRMFEGWMDLAENMMGSLWGVMRQAGSTVADVGGGGAGERASLVLHASPGQSATGPLWLKNRSSTVLARIELRCTTLESHDGQQLAAASVSFDPPSIEHVQPGATMRVDVKVSLPDTTAPGVYHGLVLAKDLPDVCRPLQVQCSGTPAR